MDWLGYVMLVSYSYHYAMVVVAAAWSMVFFLLILSLFLSLLSSLLLPLLS